MKIEPGGPIPVYLPYLGAEVHAAVDDALDEGWLGLGPLTARFEQEISSYLELSGRYTVSTNSCTGALHLASLVAGVGPGDEVICPSFTYVAGHQAVSATGADIVFCDIEQETLGVDPASVRSLVTDRTKAVMAVHYAGIACRIDEINELAAEHGLRVIEDAAHAFGTRHRGRPIGSFGDLTCFSFGPVKVITSLEGGAVITPHETDVQRLHELRLIGVTDDTDARYKRGRTWDYDVVRQGYRYHLGSVPAAIGLSQLAMIDTFISNRQRYCRIYDESFQDLRDVTTFDTDFTDVSPYIYVIRVPDGDARTKLMEHMRGLGVASGIHFEGAHNYTFYRDCRRSDLSVTERISEQVVTLPLHPFMDESTTDRVVASVRSFFE
ncbi:MAG: DegT/DnrJ/EryC1/StrS family aminotransferase [Acidimicrobiia bacterium]|nr:DegT/DnrJ/EryC1/StrS family aminotransferase [Acidimicrobiia bacterium]